MVDPEIIYEDKNFLGVYKPAGMLVHQYRAAGKMKGENTLADWLVKKYPELRSVGDHSTGSWQAPETRPGIVHRLDKETSGVMLVPRNQKYFEYFKSLFKGERTEGLKPSVPTALGQDKKQVFHPASSLVGIKKTYLAVVFGEPRKKRGTIDKPIGIKNGSIKRSVRSEKMKKNAVTEYEVKKTFVSDGAPFSLLEVHPLTGRTHQIRVHLASIGHPVVGDNLYAGKRTAAIAGRMMLHAYSLEFPLPAQAGLPNGSRIKLEAEPDKFFQDFIGN